MPMHMPTGTVRTYLCIGGCEEVGVLVEAEVDDDLGGARRFHEVQRAVEHRQDVGVDAGDDLRQERRVHWGGRGGD